MDRHHDPHHRAHDEQYAHRLTAPGGVPPTVWRTPAGAQPGSLSQQAAQLLLDSYSQPGDIVVDVDDDIALAAAAATTGRHHHALGGHMHLATLGISAGYIDILLVHWPRPAVDPHWLLLACRTLLGSAGRLVVAVRVDPTQRMAHLNALAGASATAGLHIVRHVAVLPPGTLPAATHEDAAHDGCAPGHGPNADHQVNPHTDLLIFEPDAGRR
jgi:hypothetical protein